MPSSASALPAGRATIEYQCTTFVLTVPIDAAATHHELHCTQGERGGTHDGGYGERRGVHKSPSLFGDRALEQPSSVDPAESAVSGLSTLQGSNLRMDQVSLCIECDVYKRLAACVAI